jgi:hypothetical protein
MTQERGPRHALFAVLFCVLLLVAAALWLPHWWNNRLYRQAEALTGVGSVLQPGGITQARGKIDPGKSAKQVVDALGRPSFSVGTEGSSTHEIWTYYYADGAMTINLTDGIVQRVSIAYGPPNIPKTRRP